MDLKRAHPLIRALYTTPVLWCALGFCAYAYYAQFIPTISWNAIELIIAQHLLGHGSYATSVDYPSALTWRPAVPTFLVTLLRLFTSDPIRIYQVLCGTALASVAGSLFCAAKRLWSLPSAHLAAAASLTCPAITTFLIDQPHSYSHVGMLVILGPTLCLALWLIAPDGAPVRRGPYVTCGVLWALAYLCRSELMLFAGLHFVAIAAAIWIQRRPWKHLAYVVLPFALMFAGYNLYADHVSNKDGVVIRKTIYGFYISQGWVDPPTNVGGDIEGDGYLYAIQLYGDPVANGESLARAIAHNPGAFLRRVRLNATKFYDHFWRQNFFPPSFAIVAALGLGWFLVSLRRIPFIQQLPVWYLVALFAASHFVLIYHIDARYLTVAMPGLILLIAYAAYRATQLGNAGVRLAAQTVTLGLCVASVVRVGQTVNAHRPKNEISIPAMQALAQHFTANTGGRPTTRNKEPHVAFFFPSSTRLYPEDQFLLAYFTKTAWVNGGAEGPFPRGKFYSYRDCPPDYLYLPTERANDANATRGWSFVSDCVIPELGPYRLYRPR